MTQNNTHLWNNLLNCVNQHSEELQHSPIIGYQFKRLVWTRLCLINIFVLLLQFSGLKLSTLTASPSPLWLATGTSCALIFLRGNSILVGIALGSVIAYLLVKASLVTSLGCGLVFTLQAYSLKLFCYHEVNPSLIFYNLKSFFKFIGFSVVLSLLTTLCLGFFYSYSLPHRYLSYLDALQSGLANLNAILIFSGALITCDTYFPDSRIIKKQIKTNKVYFFLLGLALLIAVLNQNPLILGLIILIHVGTILILSYKMGWVGAISTTCFSGIILCLASFLESPLFIAKDNTILVVQVLLLFELISSVCLALTQMDDPFLFKIPHPT